MRDSISRKAAIDAIEHITSSMSVCVNTDECHGMKRMQRQAVIELANLPSVQPERKKGKWIKEGGFRHYAHYCSECGWALMDGPRGEPPYIGMEFNRANYERRYVLAGWTEDVMNYCPNCGSFNGGEDETDS